MIAATAKDIVRLIAIMRQPKRSIESFVLDYGHEFAIAAAPEGFKFGKMKHCFENSAKNATSFPSRYVYCEGYTLHYGSTHHAWLYDLETKTAFDPTWPTPGDSYFGIPFCPVFLAKSLLKSGYYGLLDSPTLGWSLEMGRHSPTEFLHPAFRPTITSTRSGFDPAD